MSTPGVPSPSTPTGPDGPDLEAPDASGRAEPGTPPPPGANQPKTERLSDADVPPTGTVGAADPQAPGEARISHEGDVPGGLAAVDASREQEQAPGPGDSKGVGVGSTDAAPGTSQTLASTQDVDSPTGP